MHAILRLSHNNRSLASHFLFDTCNFDKFTKDRFLTRDLDQQYGHYAQTGQIPDCCDPTVLPYRSPARSKWMMAIKSAIGNTSTSPLLRLPRELFIQILDHLPFSSKLILQRQVCRTLRDAISVGLDLPSRLSLPSLLLARKDVREISQGIRQEHENAQDELITETCLGASKEPRDILPFASSSDSELIALIFIIQGLLPQLNVHESDLYNESMTHLTAPPAETAVEPPLRSIFAVGWHGIPGERLAQMLIYEPAFRHVETVVKSDRLDQGGWAER